MKTLLIIWCIWFAAMCFGISFWVHRKPRNRQINLPPPNAACDRSRDAGWWT